jgi:ABC-type sugar transport system substrate-binding protein
MLFAAAAEAASNGEEQTQTSPENGPQITRSGTIEICGLEQSHVFEFKALVRRAGEQIAAILGNTGCVLYIEGPSGDVAKLRSKGMLSTKPGSVDVKTVKGDWTQKGGHHVIKSWLSLSTSRQLHVSMIACQNDDMAIGARQ